MELVGLSGYGDRYPHQLSGGQQQRIAIARVLAIEPKVMLLDEPFGALDKKLRVQLQVELKKLINRLHITAVFVTHDQEEALIMSDRIAVMEKGSVVQYDTPTEIYDHPSTEFVATFIGNSNMIDGSVEDARNGRIKVALDRMAVIECENLGSFAKGDKVRVLIRPENLELRAMDTEEAGWMEGKIVFAVHLGSHSEYEVKLDSGCVIKVNIQRVGGISGFSLEERVKVSLVNEQACAVYRV